MKKIIHLLVFLAAMALAHTGWAQDDDIISAKLNDATHGTVVDILGGTAYLTDDDSQGPGAPDSGLYQFPQDRYITIKGGCTAGLHLSLRILDLRVDCLDTIYVYDGPDTNSNLLAKFNTFYGDKSVGDKIFVSPENETEMLTIRFRTDPRTDTSLLHLSCHTSSGIQFKGFRFYFECAKPCEMVIPVIDSVFYRTRNGVVYDSAYLREVFVYDTLWVNPEDPSEGFERIDSSSFIGAHLCIGDGVIFKGHGNYTFNNGYYTPSDSTSYFVWDMANEGDTIEGLGVTQVEYDQYQRTDCYDIRLDITDEFGCHNDVLTSVKVRTALNPIKTIFTLSDICSKDSLMVNMGYSGENATLTLKEIESNESVSKTYEVVTFIPDGCGCGNCTTGGYSYYEAPVEFSEFPNNRHVNSAADICSICINMEHSYEGDFFLTLVCPTGQESIIKFGNKSTGQSGCNYPDPSQSSEPGGSYGSGTFWGFPHDGTSGTLPGGGSYTYGDNSEKCKAWLNVPGVGLDYCFSRDTHYTLITGQNAGEVWSPTNPHPNGNFYIVNSGTVNLSVTYPLISDTTLLEYACNPDGTVSSAPPTQHHYSSGTVDGNLVGGNPGTHSVTTRKPSNHEEKTDYYLPYSTFSELIGCPLNGTWKIRVYDTWGSDNGWIFNWTLDMCNISEDQCKYTVGIDSLVWRPRPDSIYHDYDMGYYRGASVNMATPTISYIKTIDTAGTFPIDVFVYDEFGCVWDTSTRITSYWTPQPKLGPDTSLCGVNTMLLDGSDPHANLPLENYSYAWSPFGQSTDTIHTKFEPGTDIDYVVIVQNVRNEQVCVGRDTIHVGLRRQPLPSVIPAPFVFEGCDPFTISFENTSVNADQHYWDFGDGIVSNQPSPTHTWSRGIYDLKYYATSDEGCIDSIISPAAVAVYAAPQAAFSWNPVYPSVLSPTVHLTNLTTPRTDDNKYFWEVQYNVDNPLSVETFTTENADFTFTDYSDDEIAGNYAVRLIARTDNLAPSGNIVYCRDTAENTILVVNDFLQFPNVVTPNGDGINDRFVIKNLVSGFGYPINTLDIYNKWGALVFHKENIASDDDFWDPQNLPAGTYFYRFSAKGYNGNIEHNGAIEVIK